MQIGAITGYIDVAQVTLYAFWAFFAGVVYYCHREDKREGYPLVSERSDFVTVQGFPPIPPPKTFLLAHGGSVTVPRAGDLDPVNAMPAHLFPGAPLEPTGDPMIDGIGPASWAMRADDADRTFEDNLPKIVPLRVAPDYFLALEDPDPRGMAVIGADGLQAGVCVDAWVDRSEMLVRYLEVEVAGGPRHVLVPMTLVRIGVARGEVRVQSVLAAQFADAPVLRDPEMVTLREEDRISAYFAGGQLYATPSRIGPLL